MEFTGLNSCFYTQISAGTLELLWGDQNKWSTRNKMNSFCSQMQVNNCNLAF